MSRRAKLIAAVVGLWLGGTLVYFVLDRLLLSRSAELDAKKAGLRREFESLKSEGAQIEAGKQRLRGWARATLGRDADRVGQQVRSLLAKGLEDCGLTRNMKVQLSRPVPRPGRTEIRCRVTGEGSLRNVCDLLYLLKNEPQMHRIDGLSIKPVKTEGRGGDVRVDFDYLTLVFDELAGEGPLTTLPADAVAQVSLDGPQREAYDLIAARNVFERYVPYQPPPRAQAPPTEPRRPPEAPVVSTSPEWHYRVEGLPTWGAETVLVRNTSTGERHRYTRGDRLAGGKVVMIDYRPAPLLERPEVLSQKGRVIVQIGRDYWAVRLGQRLSEKRKLRPSELPPALTAASN